MMLKLQDIPPLPLVGPLSCLSTLHYCSQFSSVGKHHKITARLPALCLMTITKSEQKRIQSMKSSTTKKALITPPLTFLLLCDKNVIWSKANCKIAIFSQTEGKKDRGNRNLLILLKHLAATTALIHQFPPILIYRFVLD